MLRITIELLPGGNKSKAKVLAEGIITNLGTSKGEQTGDYKYKFKQKGRIWREGKLMGFPRKKYGIWALLYSILWLELDDKSGAKKK